MSGPDRIWAWPTLTTALTSIHADDEDLDNYGLVEYIRRDPAVLAALPEAQAMIAAAETRALAGVATLHMLIADIRAATVGDRPMLSDLAQALVAWRDEAVTKEREACAQAAHDAVTHPSAYACRDAIRKRGEG